MPRALNHGPLLPLATAREAHHLTLRVGSTLSERVGGDHTTRAKRIEKTVRGRARVSGRTDTILLGGAMSDVHAGAELVLAGMSDDLIIGAGSRVTAPLDLWLVGLVGLEDKLATATFDGAIVDTARTLFEREYATGVHNAGSASFSGAVYATQATGFRKLMKVSSGVRNLSSGGGGGSGDGESSPPGPSTAATSPNSAPESGLLGSTRTPSPGAAGSDSTDLARLASESSATEDVSLYRQTEDVSETTADLQEAARIQAADESPDEAARAPSRMESTEEPSTATTPPSGNDASPPDIHPDVSTPDRGTAPAEQPAWAPSSTHQHTYTKGQIRVGEAIEEFRFDLVVGSRPDKLLSDDAQASLDTAAFRIVYDMKNDVTDMARNTVHLADPEIKPGMVSDMTAVEAREYVIALHNGAVQAGDTEEAKRLQDLLNDLDQYAFDHYTAGLGQAEAAHDITPLKLPSHVDADALEKHLTALGEEELARMYDSSLSDAEQAEATKLAALYMLAAQDTTQGLDPLAHMPSGGARLRARPGGRRPLRASRLCDQRVPGTCGGWRGCSSRKAFALGTRRRHCELAPLVRPARFPPRLRPFPRGRSIVRGHADPVPGRLSGRPCSGPHSVFRCTPPRSRTRSGSHAALNRPDRRRLRWRRSGRATPGAARAARGAPRPASDPGPERSVLVSADLHDGGLPDPALAGFAGGNGRRGFHLSLVQRRTISFSLSSIAFAPSRLLHPDRGITIRAWPEHRTGEPS